MQSALTIVLAAVAMFFVDPGLAAIALAPVPVVIVIAWRYGRRARPAQQEVQQRIAELTADAEENVSGVRVIKAFAREQVQLHRFRQSVARVFEQAMIATRVQAFYTPAIGFLPNLGLAAILLFGGLAVIHGSLSIGDFSAFYTYLLMLISPDAHARLHAGNGAAGHGLGPAHLPDPRPSRRRCRCPRARRRCPRGPDGSSCAT